MDESNTTPSLLQRPKVRILGIVGIVVVLAALAWFMTRQQDTETATNTPTSQGGAAGSDRLPRPPTDESQPDADGDRLTDTDEATLGTNPNSPDTDQDALYDYEEVRVWRTDPLRGDTDGDSNPDGIEVANGFNPLGEGRFLDINAATN